MPPRPRHPFLASSCARALLGLALVLPCAALLAQTATLPPVTISEKANRDPVEKSYRQMLRGMERFERLHALAPQAQLRFRLLPRHRDTDMGNIRVDIVGETVELRVPVAPDNTFVLPRDRQAFDEDARVVPNRRRQSMTWRTEIRTPGLPPQTRRLGDMRLECEVGMEAGLISNRRGLLDRLIGAVADTPEYCHRKEPRYLFFAEQPIFSVTLVSGPRRLVLPVSQLYGSAFDDPNMANELPFCDCEVLLDRTFFLPLSNPAWPDDTLVEFETMAGGGAFESGEQTVAGIVPGRSSRADVIALLPEAKPIRFESGYEVWIDRVKPQKKRGAREPDDVAERPERIVLVDPSGLVTKARLRLPPEPNH